MLLIRIWTFGSGFFFVRPKVLSLAFVYLLKSIIYFAPALLLRRYLSQNYVTIAAMTFLFGSKKTIDIRAPAVLVPHNQASDS